MGSSTYPYISVIFYQEIENLLLIWHHLSHLQQNSIQPALGVTFLLLGKVTDFVGKEAYNEQRSTLNRPFSIEKARTGVSIAQFQSFILRAGNNYMDKKIISAKP